VKVVIIYNPNSTGDSKKNAKNLAKELRTYNVPVETLETTHAGHGEEIAADYATKKEEIILISSSGDGGYHEVVNGALTSKKSKLIVGVLASGNANDHESALGSGKLAESIRDKKFRSIDTIKVSAKIKGKKWERYAHSYVGIGVTAVAAKRLTEDRPNLLTEKWIVAHSLFSFNYAKLKVNGDNQRYSSIIFGNIDRMSKVMTLSEGASVTDGKFEMSSIRFRSKLQLLFYLLTAATKGLKDSKSMKKFTCVTVRPLPIQLDGEVYTIGAGSKIKITSVKQNLHCVI